MKKRRRQRFSRYERILLLLSVLTLVASSLGLTTRWLSTLTPVSASQAVERYHEEVATQRDPSSRQASAAPTGIAAPRPDDEPAATAVAAANLVSVPAAQAPVPEPGVYTYRTTGYEHAGLRREFPSQSHRIVGHKGDRAWTNHHIFSDERNEWYDFVQTESGVRMPFRRNKGTFGLITIDRTLNFNPPVLAFPASPAVGKSWEGSWTGPNPGNYRGKTLAREMIDVGSQRVDTWKHELLIKFEGSEYGEILLTLWYLPSEALIVREDADLNIHTGPLDYRAEYRMTLASLEPRR